MVSRPRVILLVLIAVIGALAVAGVIVVRSHGFQVMYHDWRMHASRHAFENQDADIIGGFHALSVNDDYHAYEYHRERLVDLGAVHRHDYVLNHLVRDTPEAKHFISWLLCAPQPSVIDWASPAEPHRPIELKLWCYPADTPAWDQLIQERNVHDYVQRFIAAPN